MTKYQEIVMAISVSAVRPANQALFDNDTVNKFKNLKR